MKGPMLRFVIVAALLLVLVIFYATRLGEQPPRGSEQDPAPSGETGYAGDGPVTPVAESDRPDEDWFPDLSGHNDLPGIYLDPTLGRSTFGCDMDALVQNLGRNLVGEGSDARLAQYVGMLSVSSDAEHQLAALQLIDAEALTAPGADDGTSLLEVDHLARALQADPMNPLVLWHAAGLCADSEAHSACSDPLVQSNMQSVLGGNGEYWAQVSAQRYAANDLDGSLDALHRAASAPTFDNFFMEHVRMHQRSLSLIPDIGPVERALGGYALGMTTMARGARGLIPCMSETSEPSWYDACTAVANRFASESPTIVQRALGMEMLAQIYESGGQPEAARLERERAAELTRTFWIEDEDMMSVLVTDERVLSLYLEELEAGDETNALQFLGEEVERLRQDPTYDPCPPDEVGD